MNNTLSLITDVDVKIGWRFYATHREFIGTMEADNITFYLVTEDNTNSGDPIKGIKSDLKDYSFKKELCYFTCQSNQEKQVKLSFKKVIEEENAKKLDRELLKLKRVFREDNQGQGAWKFDRLGLITGSNNPFRTDGTPIPTLDNYCRKKAVEQFYKEMMLEEESKNGIVLSEITQTDLTESRKTKMMERGNLLEDMAMDKFLQDNPKYELTSYGLCNLEGRKLGASPDGLVVDILTGETFAVEIKNPMLSSYLGELTSQTEFARYKAQLQMEMLVLGVEKAIFIVNYPEMKQLVTIVPLDKVFIGNMLNTLEIAEKKIDNWTKALHGSREQGEY